MPSMMTLPDVGFISVDNILIKVVFPAPLGPNIVRNSPFSILRLIFLRTIFVPNIFESFSTEMMMNSPSVLITLDISMQAM